MRQLVSVVTDGSVAYFLQDDDSDDVHQVAQVLNTGLGVADVIDLGANLLGALKLNGKGAVRKLAPPRALQEPTPSQPALTPELEAGPPVQRKGKGKGTQKRRPRVSWGITRGAVLEDIRAHPGTTYAAIAQRVADTEDQRAVSSVTSHVGALLAAGHPISLHREPAERVSDTGRKVAVQIAHLTYLAGKAQPEGPPGAEEE